MKKAFVFAGTLLVFAYFAFAATGAETPVVERVASEAVPELLAGIWQGSDRLLFLGDSDDAGNASGAESTADECSLVLRLFYGWYADRAVEPERYASLSPRLRNDATARASEHISVRYVTIAENTSHTAGAYELEFTYPGLKEPVLIPVCVIDGNLYMDFLVRGSAEYTDRTAGFPESAGGGEGSGVTEIPAAEGFWRDCGVAKGITVSPPVLDDELTGYYVADGAYYHIRYWLTDMPYSYDKAGFTDGDKSYAVDKYMRVAGRVYTCATGRRTQIRNIEKSVSMPSAVFDSEYVICAFGEPYLLRLEGKSTREDLQALVDEANARRAPLPKPVFPPVFPTVRWPE